MQRVLAMALGLLAVTLLLRWGESRVWSEDDPYPERGLDVVVSSRGTLLPARMDSGNRGLYEAIVAGERILVEEATTPPGLRAACFGADLEIADAESFALRDEPAAAANFVSWLEGLPVPSICILGTSGDLRPEAEEAVAAIDGALQSLGATARPHRDAPTSWAYLGVRLESGFVRLAESFSMDSGVVMLFTVRSDLRSYDGFEGEYAHSRIWGAQEVPLERDVSRGQVRGEVRAHQEFVGGVEQEGLAFDPPDGIAPSVPAQGGEASIRWERVRLGQKPYLVSQLSFPERPGLPPRSAVCEVWIDGTKHGERKLTDGGGRTLWPVDLGAYAGQTVDLELRTRSRMGKGARTPVVFWGQPKLLWSGR